MRRGANRFFFSSRRRHTRCLSDWSSDVCYSDLSSVCVDCSIFARSYHVAMKYRTFGRTGWKVSEIGFGAWAIGGSWGPQQDEDSIAALNRRSEEHTSELQSLRHLVCRLLLEKKN